MCGIAGVFRREGHDPRDQVRIATMADAIVHRGPDDFGYLRLDSRDGSFQLDQRQSGAGPRNVCLAARRLSILDLSPNGRQPFRNERDDVFLVFNGEVFNYVELRRELRSLGHNFRSETDTEVVLRAYEQWGPECVRRFNGMWAFAIWDQRSQWLFCSRDHFGIKPFYYHLTPGVFAFASEIKALLPVIEPKPRANEGVISDYLLEGALCRDRDTFFEGIHRLEPAHNLTITADGDKAQRYWDYPFGEPKLDAPNGLEEFSTLLEDSVKLRLRSDVPVGVALSGGVDSSSVLSLAAAAGPTPVKAFTAIFPGEPYDEHDYARLAGEHANGEFFPVEYDPSSFVDDLRGAIWELDYPALDAQVLPRRQVMRKAREHVKVILEGQGADEILAGYLGRYFGPYAIDEFHRIFLRQGSLSLGGLGGALAQVHSRSSRALYGNLLRPLLSQWPMIRTLRARWESNDLYAKGFLSDHRDRIEPKWEMRFDNRLDDALHYDHERAILPMLLKFGDALSMGASIESRLPFLDHRLVEAAFRLPAPLKLLGIESKVALKQSMRGMIPEAIRTRTDKVGFSTPVSSWIRQSLDSDVRPILLSKRSIERGIFDPTKLEAALRSHASGRSFGHALFRCLSVEMWFQMFIDGTISAPQSPRQSPQS